MNSDSCVVVLEGVTPSRKDLARNWSPDVVNLIISLTTTPPTVRAWWLTVEDYHAASWEVEA